MRSRFSVSLIALAASAALFAQADQSANTQPQQPTFRVGANYVRVDMYATDDGRPVEDLKADEIELREDGTPQTIETFEHVVVRAAGPQETRIEPNTVTESRQMAAEARARVLVIFLDTYHTQLGSSARMRLPLTRFLERVLGPDDLVALMTPEMSATDLTFARRTTVISNIMQDEWWGRRGRLTDRDPKEEVYEACYGVSTSSGGIVSEMMARRREKLTLDALEDLVVHLRGIREERKAVIAVTEGWRLFTEDRNLSRTTGNQPPPLAPPVGIAGGTLGVGRRGSATGVDQLECDADRMALSLLNHDRRLRDIEDAANRGNVTFYPVYAQGLTPFDAPIGPERPPPPSVDAANLSARQNSLRELAENTDGTAVIGTNDIEGGLRRIAADLSSYYLLGYYSTNTKLDGRFRNISVKVKRPGVQVRARRGYRGLTAEDVLNSSSSGTAPTAAAAAPSLSVVVNPRAQFRIRTSGWTSGEGATAAAWIVGELDYATRKDLAWSAGATADVTVVAASGREVTSASIEIPATDGAFSIRIPAEGGIAPGEYAVRVRVRPNSDAGLPVADTARLIIAEKPSPLGEPVMWRRGPSTGPRYAMTADPRFTRTERVRFEMATTTSGAATGRMLDRLGKPMQIPVQITERPDPSGSFRWIIADATLAPLATGDYAIEVTLADGKQTAGFKIVP